MSSEKSLKLIEEYMVDDNDGIIEDFVDYISGIYDEEELRSALVSLYDQGYLLGFKTALIERVESDIQTLDFMKRRVF